MLLMRLVYKPLSQGVYMYRKGLSGVLKHWDFLLLDLICVQAAFILAYLLRHGLHANPYASDLYIMTAIISEFSCLICMIFFRTLKNILKRNAFQEIRTAALHSGFVLFADQMFLFAVKRGSEYSRITLFLTTGICFVLTLSVNLLYKKVLSKALSGILSKRTLLVIAAPDECQQLCRQLSESKTLSYRIIGTGVLSDAACRKESDAAFPVLARNAQEIREYVLREWVDAVFISLPYGEQATTDLINSLASSGITLHLNIDSIYQPDDHSRKLVERLGDHSVITATMKPASLGSLAVKRFMDIFGGLIGCILTAILFLFLAPAIKLSSPGPVFFSQERIGRNGKRFKMYKFRSMYTDAEKRKTELMKQNRIADGKMFKLDYDLRIIGSSVNPDGTLKKGFGNFIRDYSLDEFPQFFNVLKGDMSLVGTRPPTVDEWERYDLRHRARLVIKPGITGLWQVSGRSNITNFEDVVRLDTKYICEWTLLLDLKILLKTIKVVLKKEGAM